MIKNRYFQSLTPRKSVKVSIQKVQTKTLDQISRNLESFGCYVTTSKVKKVGRVSGWWLLCGGRWLSFIHHQISLRQHLLGTKQEENEIKFF